MFTREDLAKGAKNFTWMLAGNYVSYALSLLTVVLVARQLGPLKYGTMNAAIAYVGMFGVLRLPGFDKVFIRASAADPKGEPDTYAQMLGLKLGAAVLGMAACAVGLVFVPFSWPERIAAMVFASTLLTQSIVSLIGGVFQAHEDMKWLPIVNLVRQTSYIVVATVGIQLLGRDEIVFVTSVLAASYLVGLSASVIAVRRYLSAPLRPAFPRLARGMFRSGLVFSISNVLVFLYTRIDILMARFWIGAGPAGLYSVALSMFDKVVNPFLLMTAAFFPSTVRRLKVDGVQRGFALRATAVFGVTGAVLAVVASVVGQGVVRLLFGDEYAGAVQPFVLLLWSLPAAVAVYPVLTVLQACGLEAVPVRLAPARALMNVTFNAVFIAAGLGISGIAWSTIVTSALYLVLFLVVGLRALKRVPPPAVVIE